MDLWFSRALSYKYQRWSRRHKARGQGQEHQKNPRPRPIKDNLTEDRPSRGQGQECSGPRPRATDTSASALQKKSLQKKFLGAPQTFTVTTQKVVLSSSRGQGNFWGLQASRLRPRTWLSRPRTSKLACLHVHFWEPLLVFFCSSAWILLSHTQKSQGVEPNLNPSRKPEWTVSFWWTQTEPEPAKFYFRELEPNLSPQNCAQVNPNRTWTPNKSKNIFFHIRMPLALVHAR